MWYAEKISQHYSLVSRDFSHRMLRNIINCLKAHNTQQNELMVEIYFKSLVRAIGKVLCMKFS